MSARRTPAQSAAARHGATATPTGASRIRSLISSGISQPSTNMTMPAFLHARGQLHTIDAFRASLATPGASMREPSNAIAACRSVNGTD